MRLSGSETILAVDDDPGLLNLIAKALQPHGYTVLMAPNGEQALQIAVSHQDAIDLLLTDVVLPGIKGQELARQMIDLCPKINVLFMSGTLCPSMAHRTADRGFEAFLQKPFTESAMLRKIRRLLD